MTNSQIDKDTLKKYIFSDKSKYSRKYIITFRSLGVA